MKTLSKSILILALSWNAVVLADTVENPIAGLRSNLESSLSATEKRNDLVTLKKVEDDRNTDMEVAFQNYLIAKKRVSIARAAFNPLTTGHILGMALGVTYLWAPIVIEAITSIPTKMYNVSSNKYLAKAALYNSYEAKLALNNELAHLYYDVVTHEVILKSIDQEIAILLYQQADLAKLPNNASRVQDNQSSVLGLKMERIDIYNLYVEEVAAMKTLLTMEPATGLDLAQVKKELSKSFTDGINEDKLQDFAIVNSNQYKTAINMHHAADQNVKSVQWSILSFAGLNFSYKARVQEAKIDAKTAADQQISTSLKVKNDVLMKLKNLDSSLNIFENYNSIYNQSMGLSEDYYKLYSTNNATEDAAVETSIAAIRDFRNKVVAHYAAWSSMDDFSKAANFNFQADGTAQSQIEKSALYDLSESDFKVVKRRDYSDSFTLAIDSDRNTIVDKVEYKFDNDVYPSTTSTRDTKDFYAIFTNNKNDAPAPAHYSGTATIYLNNGHELTVNFKF